MLSKLNGDRAMKNLITILIFWFAVNTLSAQTTFLVTDNEGIPVSNVSVILNNITIGKTDKEGMIKVSTIKKNDTVLFKSEQYYSTYTYISSQNNPSDLQEIELELQSVDERLGFGSNDPVPIVNDQRESEIYEMPEVLASFPGGAEKMELYISKVLRKPEMEHNGSTKLNCYVKMVVEKDGMLSNIQLVKGITNCPACDKEAIRVVKSMPKFIPAMNNGRAVRSYFIFPVKFD